MAKETREKSGDSDFDPNAWMVTFGDLLMLLLTFFVLLLTMKSLDGTDTNDMFQYFTESQGPLGFMGGEKGKGEDAMGRVNITSSSMLRETLELMEGMRKHHAKRGEVRRLREIIDITEDNRGVVISMESENLFKPAAAEISNEGLTVLDATAKLFQSATNDILIMGHTDDIAIKTRRFRSNWELSFYRAMSVLFYLSDSKGLRPVRLAAGGYGPMRPRYPNDSMENRAKNRRVEFVLRQSR